MISVFELFKIGIGPSSSHTVGPMKAARAFVDGIEAAGNLGKVTRLRVDLFGSLAWTGKGHGTDRAVILGLAGEIPETVDPEEATAILNAVTAEEHLRVGGVRNIHFADSHIVFDGVTETPRHPNTMRFTAFDAGGEMLVCESWCSVGGGFIVREEAVGEMQTGQVEVPFDFHSGKELLRLGRENKLSIADIVLANELAQRPRAELQQHLDRILDTMMICIDRGLATEGELPGGLKVQRRARGLRRTLEIARSSNTRQPHEIMDQISLYAIAVNEENAAGGRVVTAPTNGAAGVVPAVVRYYRDHCPGATAQGINQFLLTATAIGALFKMNASISGAEVGCQGEVGVACSMAAAGLAAALGGSNEQVENAAEIGMEHHLGMTCDPIGGLVQIPCIERNAFGAVKAITAASLALHGNGNHHVSLDQVVATMRQTGADMQSKYKETSQGGLAVNLTEC